MFRALSAFVFSLGVLAACQTALEPTAEQPSSAPVPTGFVTEEDGSRRHLQSDAVCKPKVSDFVLVDATELEVGGGRKDGICQYSSPATGGLMTVYIYDREGEDFGSHFGGVLAAVEGRFETQLLEEASRACAVPMTIGMGVGLAVESAENDRSGEQDINVACQVYEITDTRSVTQAALSADENWFYKTRVTIRGTGPDIEEKARWAAITFHLGQALGDDALNDFVGDADGDEGV